MTQPPDPQEADSSSRGTQAIPLAWRAAIVAAGGVVLVGALTLTRPPHDHSSHDHQAPATPTVDVADFPRGSMAGTPAPDFSADLLEGDRFTLANFRVADGRPLVLNLWASWCAPCRVEMPEFSRVAETNPHVAFLGVAVDDTYRSARDFASEIGVSFPLGFDDDSTVREKYPYVGLPTTYLIGADGSVARMVGGQINADLLQAFIDHDFPAGTG